MPRSVQAMLPISGRLTAPFAVSYLDGERSKSILGKTMRTLFEDTNVRADLEEGAKSSGSQYQLLILWFVALAFLGGTGGLYLWVTKRPAPTPPPPPVSLKDLKQVSTAFSQFN